MASNVDADDLVTKHYDPDGSASVTDAWEGEFLHTSWGYNQTNVELAQILEVSSTGKTVSCRLVKPEVASRGQGSEKLSPTGEQYGHEFRLYVRDVNGSPVFRGSYPHCNGDVDAGTRKGHFYRLDPDDSVHQTPIGYRH